MCRVNLQPNHKDGGVVSGGTVLIKTCGGIFPELKVDGKMWVPHGGRVPIWGGGMRGLANITYRSNEAIRGADYCVDPPRVDFAATPKPVQPMLDRCVLQWLTGIDRG